MNWLPLIVGFVFAVIGVVFLVVALKNRKKAQESLAWPTTSGVVQSTDMQVHRHYDLDNRRTSYTYEPVVEYTYSLMGQGYSSKKIAFGATGFNQRKAQEILARYPQGATVTVHYNPQNPGEAVLETTAKGGVAFIIAAVAFIVIGLAILVLGLLP